MESLFVVPGHPFRCRHGNVPGTLPRTLEVDKLLLVQGIHRLGSDIIIGIALAPDRPDRPDIFQALGVTDRCILNASVRMVNQLTADVLPARPDRHFQRVQGKISLQMISDLPADNLAGKQVSNECRVRKSRERIRIRDVSDPAAVRRGRGEVPPQQVSGPLTASTGHGRARLLPPGRDPGDAQLFHQPLHRAPRHLDALAPQLQPHLPRPVHPPAFPAVFPHPPDLLLQLLVPPPAARRPALTFLHRVIGGGRKFQDRAGRLHAEPALVRIYEPD